MYHTQDFKEIPNSSSSCKVKKKKKQNQIRLLKKNREQLVRVAVSRLRIATKISLLMQVCNVFIQVVRSLLDPRGSYKCLIVYIEL